MRIGISAPLIEPKPTGVGVYSINIINHLASLHDPLIVYTSDPSSLKIDYGKVRKVCPLTKPHFGLMGFLSRTIWMQLSLPIRAIIDGVSVILSTGSEGILWPLLPQVVTVHDLTPLLFPDLHPYQPEPIFFRYLLPQILRHSEAIIAVSESTKQDIVRCYNLTQDKIHVIYEGYDPAVYHPYTNSHHIISTTYDLGPYIYYSGNLLPHKNIARLIEAFNLIALNIPHKLVLQGKADSRYMADLKLIINKSKLQDRVVFLGYVSSEYLPHLYCAATAFTLVSLKEGFGLPVLEAMACGTPVVASNTSSLPEVVGNAGILVDPNDTEQIAEALLQIIEHPELRAELSQKSLKRAAQFSWSTTAKQTLEVLQSVSRDK